jgi:hypothetical protein
MPVFKQEQATMSKQAAISNPSTTWQTRKLRNGKWAIYHYRIDPDRLWFGLRFKTEAEALQRISELPELP